MTTNAGKRKPYQIQEGPQAEDIDSMFEQLYRRIDELQAQIDAGSDGVGDHDLLGAEHVDTTPAAPVNGDLIVAQAGAWARKEKGANAEYLQMIAGAPEWDPLDAADLTGVVPTASVLHDVLSAHHQDSVPASPQLGDVIVALNETSPDAKYWLAGEAADILATALEPGSAKYWLAGSPMTGIASLGDVAWQRKGIGAAGYVPVSDGARWDWQPLSAVSGNRGASAYRSSDLTLTDLVEAAITFDATHFDDGGFWSAGSPTRLTVPSADAGLYAINAAVALDVAIATGHVQLFLKVNGVEVARNSSAASNTVVLEGRGGVTYIGKLAAGDYVELFAVIETSSGSHTLKGGSTKTYLQLAKV